MRSLGEAALDWLRRNPALLVLSLVTALAFLLRVWDVTDNPRGFFADEAAFGLEGQAILESARDRFGNFMPFLFRSFGEYKLPVFTYAQVPFVGVLGLSELSVRLTAAVLGSLTVITTYLLASELFRRGSQHGFVQQMPALAAAAMLAVLPWHVHYSRTGLGDMVSWPLFFTLAWYLFLRAQREGRSLLPAVIAFGICFYTYRSGWVVLPPFLALLALSYHRELLASWRHTAVAAGVLLVMLLPLAEHLLFGPGDRATQAWIFNVETEQSTLGLFIDQYRSYFTLSFLFEAGDNGFLLRHYLPGQGVLYWFMLPLILAGVAKVLTERDRRGLMLLALLLLYPLPGAVSDTSPISSRAILGSVVAVLLSGYGLAAIVELAASWRPRLVPGIATGVAAAVLVAGTVSAAGYLQRYHNEYERLSAGYWGWQDGPQEIIGRFLELQSEYDELYLEGFFNAPRIFIPFYAGDDCSKCDIGGVDAYDPSKRQLFAFRVESPELERIHFEVREWLFYPDGSPSFVMVEITGMR